MSCRALRIFSKASALRLLGAVFCAVAALSLPGCEKKGSPVWAPSESQSPSPEICPTPPVGTNTEAPSIATPSQGEVRFITYNLENWLTMNRRLGNQNVKGAPKPDSEKQAVVKILTRHTPDVVGLCEIGTRSDLADLQAQLKTAGLDLPYSCYTSGADPDRHLALLSRFPINFPPHPPEIEYQLTGQTHSMNRGILDSIIEAHGKSYRFIGVHLKSKRDSEQGDQELIRRNEAHLLRRHVDSILKADKNARLIIYGDFNDTRSTPAIKTITGKYNDPGYLTAIPAKDSKNESWTHFWALQDIYSRFDFIFVSREMRKGINFHETKIIDDAGWDEASDHRAVMAVLK